VVTVTGPSVLRNGCGIRLIRVIRGLPRRSLGEAGLKNSVVPKFFRNFVLNFREWVANSKNYKLKTKQKGMTPVNTQRKTSMKHTRILLLIALLGAAAVGLPSVRGATITVTELGDGFGVHTNLRQALADANSGDTIEFNPLLGGWNLPLAPVLGQLVVNKSVTIRWVPTVGYLPYLGVDA